MVEFSAALKEAWLMIFSGDRELFEIVLLSLKVSLSAVFIAVLVGIPLGAWLALSQSRWRRFWVVVTNSFMGLPPVVVGLVVYLLLSRAGPLGKYGLLFTPTAMIIAQAILVTPIIAALSRQTIQDANLLFNDWFLSLRLSTTRRILTLVYETRYSLITAILGGFGRASAEVGAVMIVGGNISHHTRVMTTTIAMETSKGNLEIALGLGSILLMIIMLVNLLANMIQNINRRQQPYG